MKYLNFVDGDGDAQTDESVSDDGAYGAVYEKIQRSLY